MSESLAADFNWPAVMKGFEIASKMDYHSAHAELAKDSGGDTEVRDSDGAHDLGDAHPVSCIDCHDPKTMHVRVHAPASSKELRHLAASKDKVPHLPSVERWRSWRSQRNL